MATNVLIYAEQIGGTFRGAAYEAVCQGKKMAQELGGQAIAVGIGSGIAEAAKDVDHILVVEMSMGQMTDDVRLAVDAKIPVSFFGRSGGVVPTPEEVISAVKKLL